MPDAVPDRVLQAVRRAPGAMRFGMDFLSRRAWDHAATDRIDNLVGCLDRDFSRQLEFELATRAAEAQVEIERVRQAKLALVNRAYARLRHEHGRLLSTDERAALAFAGKVLMACERYERRAISRRNRAPRTLAKLQRELRGKEAIEVVGPPRPKSSRTRPTPFREYDVLRLQVEQVMRSSPWNGSIFHASLSGKPAKAGFAFTLQPKAVVAF